MYNFMRLNLAGNATIAFQLRDILIFNIRNISYQMG